MVKVLLKVIKLSQVSKQEILCPANYCKQSLIDTPQSKNVFHCNNFLVGFASNMKRGRFSFSIIKQFWYL